MTSAWSQLEQMLTCAICLDKFKNPRLLPCQHSFCGDACMEGLVDYARRQIKCPECRAEHRIPYQGVGSLPVNVTLIRFLELHARITGEEPEPVPTFMEKCSVCGEKIEGVQRCAHCDKKVCPECKEAHIDLLRREINRINGQAKRCLSKMQEFKETLVKSEERLEANKKSVRREIEDSCRRLIDDLQLKQKKLLDEVDVYVEQEQKTIDKLKVAICDELLALEANSKLADDKLISNKFQWTDQELNEVKEIYAKAMEFVRLFDPDIGDYTRKMRFNLIPEFETMRRRLCELGELKFAETATSLMASSLQYCNATGSVAMELCQAAANQAVAQLANGSGANTSAGGYGLSHSNSNSNLGNQLSASNMLELPSMQNALMRSQSDHRLASQFQQRLKQQQQQQQQEAASKNSYTSRYAGAGRRDIDYETEAIRSRYAPPRLSVGAGSNKDYGRDSLSYDWPRPADNDNDLSSYGSSTHYKSAFMRRKEKERQQYGGYSSGASYNQDNNDDDDLISEASYGGLSTTGRNVRFYDGSDQAGAAKQVPRLFDCKELQHAPLSGVPKLDDSPHLLARLHQMGAKSVVDKKHAEEDSKRDKELIESSRQAMNKAKSAALRQMSEDEIEKQKRANKQEANESPLSGSGAITASVDEQASHFERELSPSDVDRHSPTPAAELHSSASTVIDASDIRPNNAQTSSTQTPAAAAATTTATTPSAPSTPPSPAVNSAGGRRNLYGQAVNEKSKRQLSNAIQDAASYSSRRKSTISSSVEGDLTTPSTPETPSAGLTSTRPKRTLRSSGRSMSKDRQQSVDSSSGTVQRRRKTLNRAESSQRSISSTTQDAGEQSSNNQAETNQSKNYTTGSGGNSDSNNYDRTRSSQENVGPLMAGQQQRSETGNKEEGPTQGGARLISRSSTAATDQTSATTDDLLSDDEDVDDDDNSNGQDRIEDDSVVDNDGDNNDADSEDQLGAGMDTIRRRPADRQDSSVKSDNRKSFSRTTTANSMSTDRLADDATDGEDDDDDDEEDDKDDEDETSIASGSKRNSGNRRSREMLPNAMNKLLDRSAQIRKDSQEQRSRGNSPQRENTRSSSRSDSYDLDKQSTRAPTTGYTYSARSTATPVAATASTTATNTTATGYSSSPGGSSSNSTSPAYRQRLNYQRSHSIRDGDDDSTNNSSNSSYTTASSGGLTRRTSNEDNDNFSTSSSGRRTSGHSSDRTLTTTSSYERPSASTYSRRDSSDRAAADTNTGFQSRFLSRSRTSAALGGSSTGSPRTQDSDNDYQQYNRSSGAPESSARAYLSSRDRFMQSAALMNQSSPTSSTSASGSGASGTGYSGSSYTSHRAAAGSSGISGVSGSGSSPSSAAIGKKLGLYRHQPVSKANYSDNSPFIESDDGDDQYSAYFPTGNIRSEYLRKKFSSNRYSSSGNSSSTSSAALLRSRSTHSAFAQDEPDISNNYDDLNSDNDAFSERSFSGASGRPYLSGSRRSSIAAASFDSQSGLERSVYSSKNRMMFKLGSRGNNASKFTWPRGVATGIGARGRQIVVADSSNHRVQVFDSTGRFLHEFGSYGSGPGEFDCLAGVAISRLNKNYIVSDRYNHRVQIFDMSGKFIRSFGEMGRDLGKFNLPWGVAVDSMGQIYVCDKENHRIQVFSSDGIYLNKFGVSGSQPGQLQHPHYIAINFGKIVVTDTNNHRVQLFDSTGRLINTIGREGSSNGQFKFPRGVAMDDLGYIIVGDSGNNRLQIFNPDGQFIKSIGTWGSAEGEFKGIEGVAVDNNYNILVCDRENHRIQVF